MIELRFLKEMMLIRQVNEKECDICHYWYFLFKGLKSQLDVYKGYHCALMMSTNLTNIAVLNIHDTDYRCIISGIKCKCEAINLMQNIDLAAKSGTL